MNIVKGVADLIRRTSSGQSAESSFGHQPQGFSPPTPKIRFSEVGDEAVLSALWERFHKSVDKVEKEKMFHIFIKQFLVVFKKWEPANGGHLQEPKLNASQPMEYSSLGDVVVGCSAGHPTEVILTFIEEVMQLSTCITELNTSLLRSVGSSETLTSWNITSERLLVLDALTIAARSIHNCKILGYYGGILKLTALLKGAVIQLKTVSGALTADESLSSSAVEITGLLQQVLVYVVSIICGFIDLTSRVYEKTPLCGNVVEFSEQRADASSINIFNSLKVSIPESRLQWHQKAVVSVMEAGGLNWLVELLRVIRRLCMKERWTDISLQFLTMRTLCLALSDNPRGQNHFKSIGGLEVLLDGLGLPSINVLILKNASQVDEKRYENPLAGILQLHVLSLYVLKEAVFGNLNNLQFLCENGRVHKFANSFCSLAFMLQEYKKQAGNTSGANDIDLDARYGSLKQLWNAYIYKLCEVLCSFLLAPVDVKSYQVTTGRIALPPSSLYSELSIKWVIRVLMMVIPFLKACSNENELPNHLRAFVNTLQHFVLSAFRKVLVSSPASLGILREEGIWDLIFSENFFYFGPPSEEFSGDFQMCNVGLLRTPERESPPDRTDSKVIPCSLEILQMEAISFVEVAATLNESSHNLPELSVLLDAVEQSACSPVIAGVLAKSLLRILQLSPEKAVISFKMLNGAPRVLKVACIQAQELRRSANKSLSAEISHMEVISPLGTQRSYSCGTEETWLKCMKTCMELFTEFFSMSDEVRNSILQSSVCIDCLFELFWEKSLRNHVLKHILELMKIVPLSEEDQRVKLQVCSKYLETFTQLKERDRDFVLLSVDLLICMRDMIQTDPVYYQALFRDGECFLHIVSLLNGNLDEAHGENLVLNVLQTLTCLLASNDSSKAAFRALAGKGYQTLQSLLLDIFRWQPGERLLNALLDMLVDGKFDVRGSPLIKNEDVIILYLSVLHKSSDSLRCHGLSLFQQLLRDSISNRASCVRAGMLSLLLDWFSQEDSDSIILKIAQLIQVIGGHSISGKDIRKIFALLRSEKVGNQLQYCSVLLKCVLSMLNEKGPTAFFDMNGSASGIIIKTPILWPVNRGFSFSCWLRIESFPASGKVGLFSFLTDNGRGCFTVLGKDMLIYATVNMKRQWIQMPINLIRKKWHFLCLTHSIGRPFSGGSLVRCYVDGDLVSSERCSYAKVTEQLTSCSIGTKLDVPQNDDNDAPEFFLDTSPFLGQIGPVYLFNDAISSEQVQAIYNLGPSYMYSFLENETAPFGNYPMSSGIFDSKDGLASKIIFGLNAQASDGRKLFNVSRMLDHLSDKISFKAIVMLGTELCSRSLLQQIIYCVGGVSVFFPLISQSDRYVNDEDGISESSSLLPVTKDRLTAEVIELIASVLDENSENQQQMHILAGCSILGFLLQSVPPQQLNLETLSSLKHLFNIVASSGFAELLVKDAISNIFLNPLIWLYAAYQVQRELYMFLIQQFDNDPRLLKSLCRLPRVIDIIRQFYWDTAKSRSATGSRPLLHPITEQIIGERPNREEIHKIRLLLVSLGEMSLRQNIATTDIKALVAFCETSQDMPCIEDILHMVIRAVSQTPLLASFLEQVNIIGGCHIFINLLQRDFEPIRLLSLQFLGRLLVGVPSEKRGPRFFNLAVGRSRDLSENHKKISPRMQPIFSAMSDRLFRFPQTENLCATLFDVLLGGASPKQVLQKQNQLEQQRSKGKSSHFFLPQILNLIFKFLCGCEDTFARTKIISDLLDLLDSNPLNIEALMEYGWNAWLSSSIKLCVIENYKPESQNQTDSELNEQKIVRNLFSVVLCHYIVSVKGGWQQIEETVNFLLLKSEQSGISYWYFLRDIYEDLIQQLVELSSEDSIFNSQPCRDNMLYLLRLLDEMLISETGNKLPFPAISPEFSLDSTDLKSQTDYSSTLDELLQGGLAEQTYKYWSTLDELLQEELEEQTNRCSQSSQQLMTKDEELYTDKWWNLYDHLWIIISEMNGKGPSRMLSKSSVVGPSIGQRARGLVESLNIPAAEMAAVVVSGGIGNALGGKMNKNVDKAMLLRGERCPRIIYRLVILYMCRSSLERASLCVQQVISLLPHLLSTDDEQCKSRLQLFIGALLAVRSQYGILNDGARFHVIAHLIRETVNSGKALLVSTIIGRDESSESVSNSSGTGSLRNLILKDRVLSAVSDEARYINMVKSDRAKQLLELSGRIDGILSLESNSKKAFEDDLQSNLNTILASDDSRRAAFELSLEEQQQNISEKWMHMFRSLIDERGPWSANPFPNNVIKHWKLDKTEDEWRRRPKLRQNYHFDEKLCYASAIPNGEFAALVSETRPNFVAHIPEQMKQFLLKGVRRVTEEGHSEPCENDSDQSVQKLSVLEDLTESQGSDLHRGSGDQKGVMQDKSDFLSSSPDTEANEVIRSVLCVLVTPRRKVAGHLAVMKKALHFFGEFLVEGNGGAAVFKNFNTPDSSDSTKPEQKHKFIKWPSNFDLSEKGASVDNIGSGNLLQKQLSKIKRHRRWNLGKVKAVHWTRYLLRYTAIEVSFSDSMTPIFLNFALQKDAKEIGTLIVATRNELLFPKGSSRDKSGIISLVDRRLASEMAETARERWRRRDITNFEYLMILNTLAGRTYNDLTQYPVFPWVLADYSSDVLDFNKSSTFRDLSKPVGALDSKRFEVFEDRYHNFSDPDIPSFYYGSHYSSMGIVLYYLLRLEPFTSLHRNLQGGKFDHADRLFQSIEGTFRNCMSNTSDVKELIPEFFYMPEFLMNSNSYHLGVKQDGEPIGDVCLPSWAKGSPELFISQNREALESEYVSSNLHHWIDLIFGYKQRGKAAVEAANIFYYLTYEGAVDLETMEDELQSSAIEDQIANFGQTPIQIFRKKHPRRGPPNPVAHPLYFAPTSISLTSITASTIRPPSAILYVGIVDSNIVLINQGLTLSVKMWLSTQLQSGGNYTFSGSQEPFFEVGSDILSPRIIGSSFAENVEIGSQCFATMPTPQENFLVSCGNWENSFQVISLSDGRVVQSVRHHKDVVSCIAVTSDGSILASGSYDTTIMVWETLHVRAPEKRVRNMQTGSSHRDFVVADTPFHILCGHDDIITCLYVSVELDIVISGSKDGTCVFHTLREGRYIRSLRHPSGSALSKLATSRHGRIVFYADNDLSLHMYSINGKHLASSESNGRLNCLELSWCGEFLVCAGDQGQIVVRSMNSLEVVGKYSGVGKIITSLRVTMEECFIAGTKDGNLLVYSLENLQLRKPNLPRNLKSKAPGLEEKRILNS